MKAKNNPINEKELDLQISLAETKKRRRFNPYRSVMGKNPTEVEMAAWGHDKWMDFLRFIAIFIEKDKDDEDTFKYTTEKRNVVQEYLDIPSHPYHEFIYRVDKWPDESDNKDYRYRFQTMVRIVLQYLKKHPALVNSDMRILMDAYPKRMGWALVQYKVAETHAGDIVQRDEAADNNVPVKLPSIQQKLMNSLVIMSDMYELIASSIGEKEVKNMRLDEKIKALKDLNFIFSQSSKKAQTNHLTQINISGQNSKAVEESMLDFIKKSQKE